MRICCCTLLLTLGVAVFGGSSAFAQNNRFTERPFVSAPSVRAMGDAGVALPGPERPFFYNPAHLPHLSSYFTVVGVQAAASRRLQEQLDFFNRRIQPAIEANFDLETEVLSDLYGDAYRLGRQPVRGTGAVVLPAFVYSTGGVGVGGGLFAKTSLNYRVNDGGLGVPEVYLLSRTDVLAVLSFGIDLERLGLSGVSIGGTVKRGRRFLAFENKPLDAFTPDEAALLLRGSTVQVELGGRYEPSWWRGAGQLFFGGAAYDLLGSRYDYAFGGAPRIPFLEGVVAESAAVDAGTATQEANRARRLFRLEPSYRVGLGYRLASLSILDDVGLAADYQGYGHDRQHPLARLHFGVRADLIEGVTLRAGLSAGYPTGGVGIRVGALRVDYAVHGFEEGRVPGQISTYVHSARLLLRIQ